MVNVVLVNGLPGSGKSTLAAPLAEALSADLVSKDALKVALTTACPWIPAGQVGPIAAELQWRVAARATGTTVIESWFFAPRDRHFVVDALTQLQPDAAVEVWCEVSPAIARRRYSERTRPSMFEDARHLSTSWPEWADRAAPLDATPVLRFDTTEHAAVAVTPARISALAEQVTRALTQRWSR